MPRTFLLALPASLAALGDGFLLFLPPSSEVAVCPSIPDGGRLTGRRWMLAVWQRHVAQDPERPAGLDAARAAVELPDFRRAPPSAGAKMRHHLGNKVEHLAVDG